MLQCLLHLSTIRKQISDCDNLNVLGTLMHRYENKMPNMSTYIIRQCLGEYFSKDIKRDASEFLTAVCTKFEYIKSLIKHEVTSITRCKSCGNTNTIIKNNILISIPIIYARKKAMIFKIY